MTTKCTASFRPPVDMLHSKDRKQIQTNLEWVAMYQESIGLVETAQQTRSLIQDWLNKGMLK